MATHINRDPFGRRTLMREKLDANAPIRPCVWCGNRAKFKYGWESDGARHFSLRHELPFCGVADWRNYYGE
jgi:hypothetical protein